MLPPVCQNGGRKRAARLPTSGLWGASTLAKIATRPTLTRIKVGIRGKSPSRKETRRHRKRGGGRTMVSAWVLIGHYLSRRIRGSITAYNMSTSKLTVTIMAPLIITTP